MALHCAAWSATNARSAHVRAKDPASGVLAEHLLAPLVNWRDLPSEPALAAPVEPEPAA
jgi:hypothetical protein